MSRNLLLLGLVVVVARSAMSAKILAAMPALGRSHHFVFRPYLEALGKEGHQVTHLTLFPSKTPVPNVTDIDMSSFLNLEQHFGNRTVGSTRSGFTLIFMIYFIANLGRVLCENLFESPPVQKLIKSDEHFDLVIAEAFNLDCLHALVHKFNAPLILMGSGPMLLWYENIQGNPDNPAYITTVLPGYTNNMNFFQRFFNTFCSFFSKVVYKLFGVWPQQRIVNQHLGSDVPSLSDITANASMVFFNSHFTVFGARPFVPGTAEVGGIHIQPSKKLPKDIKEFLDGAKEGVVYFSMGSNIKSATFPLEKKKAFLEAFAEIPQRVLWKFEESMPEKPNNVKIGKWMPQNDILGHPNVRVFISHGGLLGTTEAVHNAVPMIGIPIAADQTLNVRNLAAQGMGVELQYEDITKETVLAALRAVFDNPSYRHNATRLSREFKDRPLPPLETALYWTEYVLRHRGAPHLRSAGTYLPWYQYHLLDVFVTLLVATMTAVFTVVRLVTLCCKRKASVVTRQKKSQ